MGYIYYFPLTFLTKGFCSKVTVSRETSVHIRCRKLRCSYPERSSRKKLRRLFIDLKSIEKRKTTPIIEQFGEIVSISGVRQ